jgi:hypothetical protein
MTFYAFPDLHFTKTKGMLGNNAQQTVTTRAHGMRALIPEIP